MNQAPSARVYNILELAHEIHEYCDIGVATNLALCDRSNHSDMQSLIQKRVSKGLFPSFETSGKLESENYAFNANRRVDMQDAFFCVLSDCNGAIYGSFALTLFEPGARSPWTPNNLNIAVPWHKSEKMANFLTSEGYKLEPRRHIMHRWYHLIHDNRTFTKEACPPIFLCEGYDDTVLPIILASDTTATINCLTSRSYYSFYPTFTRQGWAIAGWQGAVPKSPSKITKRGYTYFKDPPLKENRLCGTACTVNPRRVRGRNGIGVVVWKKEAEESHRLDGESFVWKLGFQCRNRHCQYRTSRDLRIGEDRKF